MTKLNADNARLVKVGLFVMENVRKVQFVKIPVAERLASNVFKMDGFSVDSVSNFAESAGFGIVKNANAVVI